MVLTERRRADNALLREKIDHIQHTSQQLKDLVDQVQGQAVAHIQQDIQGAVVRDVVPVAALISDEELAALLK